MVDKAMSASRSMAQPDGRPDGDSRWRSDVAARSLHASESGIAADECCADTAASRRIALLARTIEHDVIPRIVLAHRTVQLPAYVDRVPGVEPTPEDVVTLTALTLRADLQDVEAFVHGLEANGVPLDQIYVDLLAPVARRLGEMWDADECDFATVTMGLAVLQQVVLNSGRRFSQAPQLRRDGRRAMLLPAPGEEHTFGLVIVAEFFRRAGWEVWSGNGVSLQEVIAKVRSEPFAIAAFSLASEDHLAALTNLIQRVRRASLNRRIGILVGGAVFIQRPGLVWGVGADATAADSEEATLQAEALLAISEMRA